MSGHISVKVVILSSGLQTMITFLWYWRLVSIYFCVKAFLESDRRWICSCATSNRQHNSLHALQFSISPLQTRIRVLRSQLQIYMNCHQQHRTKDKVAIREHEISQNTDNLEYECTTRIFAYAIQITDFLSYQIHRFAVRGLYCLGSITIITYWVIFATKNKQTKEYWYSKECASGITYWCLQQHIWNAGIRKIMRLLSLTEWFLQQTNKQTNKGILIFEGMCVWYHLLMFATKHLECWYSKDNAPIITYCCLQQNIWNAGVRKIMRLLSLTEWFLQQKTNKQRNTDIRRNVRLVSLTYVCNKTFEMLVFER
jgi:hypothetical protein